MKVTSDNSALKRRSLAGYVDWLQSNGHYTFSRKQYQTQFHVSDNVFMTAAHRLATKGRLIKPVRGFYAIVPLEYSKAKNIPVSWYIDDLMRYLGANYYISLLSAAALYGAGHQQPQVFQVFSDIRHRDIVVRENRIKIITISGIERHHCQKNKTQTGYYAIGIPEQVAVDLVRFYKYSGYLNNVATVLSEIADQLSPDKIVQCAQTADMPTAQRLGYLLDFIEEGERAKPLLDYVTQQVKRYVKLRPDLESDTLMRDKKWKLHVNERIELDI